MHAAPQNLPSPSENAGAERRAAFFRDPVANWQPGATAAFAAE